MIRKPTSRVRAFLAGRAHSILKSIPKPLLAGLAGTSPNFRVRAFLAGRAHPILQSIPKPLLAGLAGTSPNGGVS
ncbi:hypothetical protein LguiB_015350 [Lonicera macranthoides]